MTVSGLNAVQLIGTAACLLIVFGRRQNKSTILFGLYQLVRSRVHFNIEIDAVDFLGLLVAACDRTAMTAVEYNRELDLFSKGPIEQFGEFLISYVAQLRRICYRSDPIRRHDGLVTKIAL